METIHDSQGTIICLINESMGQRNVYDLSGSLLGWCANGQTRTANGTLVANSEVPGLLV